MNETLGCEFALRELDVSDAQTRVLVDHGGFRKKEKKSDNLHEFGKKEQTVHSTSWMNHSQVHRDLPEMNPPNVRKRFTQVCSGFDNFVTAGALNFDACREVRFELLWLV